MRIAQLRLRLIESILVTGSVMLSATGVGAQASGNISGSVTDSNGSAVYGAEVSLAGSQVTVRSDSNGEFRIASVPQGLVTLRVRRLGFTAVSFQAQVKQQNEPIHIGVQLAPVAMGLSPIMVRAQRVNYTGRLAGYYQRMEHQFGGYFIAREQIDRENPQMLSQLLTHVPGVSTLRMRGGGGGVRMRGRNCWPLVWLDGLPMGAGEVDLDAFPPSSIQGIELYLGATSAPAKYMGMRDQASCGTILLWSRGPDTDPVGSAAKPNWDLERLVASLNVFTADQVDRCARLDSLQPVSVSYPPPLFAARVTGTVIAEFVVDTAGRVEDGTFGIVSSPSPLFSQAVREAVQSASYMPAIRHGLPVRQVVLQPFDFTLQKPRPPGG